MKLSLVLAAAASAGFGLVSAAPVRVVVVAVHKVPIVADGAALADVRFGHAAAGQSPPHFIHGGAPVMPSGHHHGCHDGVRAKINHLSNVWRKIFGLEEIPEGPILPPRPPIMNFHGPAIGVPSIMPLPAIIPTIPSAIPADFVRHGRPVPSSIPVRPHPYYHGPVIVGGAPHFHHRQSSFFQRLGHALAVMGPWEGRALAFVLGCGLGVLIRMFFVFAVLAVRARRCRERSVALPVEDVVFVVPEEVIYPEEKQPIEETADKPVIAA